MGIMGIIGRPSNCKNPIVKCQRKRLRTHDLKLMASEKYKLMQKKTSSEDALITLANFLPTKSLLKLIGFFSLLMQLRRRITYQAFSTIKFLEEYRPWRTSEK